MCVTQSHQALDAVSYISEITALRCATNPQYKSATEVAEE